MVGFNSWYITWISKSEVLYMLPVSFLSVQSGQEAAEDDEKSRVSVFVKEKEERGI